MLRTDNRGVAKAFAEHREAINSNGQYYTGREGGNLVLYSYGKHWPVAAWINGQLHINDDRYGVTTSKHRSYMIGAMVRFGERNKLDAAIHHETCANMCRAIRGHAL
jgi:hypothetical protein